MIIENDDNADTNTPVSFYFAAAPTEDIASELQAKVDDYYDYIVSSNLVDLWRRAYYAYYGMRQGNSNYGWNVFSVAGVQAGGNQGEITRVKVNHFANLITHQMSLIGQRPALKCRARNTDAESLVSADLGDGILEYELKENKLGDAWQQAVETSLVTSEGYVGLDWDPSLGDPYMTDENGKTVFNGKITASNFTPFEVVRDIYKRSPEDHNWIMTYGTRNKYDLMAEHPDLAQKIDLVSTDQTTIDGRVTADPTKIIAIAGVGPEDSDDIPYIRFYHKPTPALPQGRYVIFINGDLLLYDGPLPFKEIPVYRVAPRNVLGTPFGWTTSFDILVLQELVDKLYTIVSSNVLGSGVSNFWSPPGNNFSVSQLGGGRNLIETLVKPELLDMLKTPAEVYNYINKVESMMEKLTGLSAVNRGDMPSKDMSGTALAFMAAQAITYNSGAQESAKRLAVAMGNGVISILKDYATTERIAYIAGKQKSGLLKKMFKGSDLEPINNVVAEEKSAFMETQAGKVAVADNLLANGMIKDPQEYITLIKTGNMDTMLSGQFMENVLIQQENQWLLEGRDVIALILDDHAQHILEHKSILASPLAREDAGLVARTLRHIEEHEQQMAFMQINRPALLAATKQPPLPLPQMPMPQAMEMEQADAMPMEEQPMEQGLDNGGGVQMPRQPNLPNGTPPQMQEAYAQLLQTQQ